MILLFYFNQDFKNNDIFLKEYKNCLKAKKESEEEKWKKLLKSYLCC